MKTKYFSPSADLHAISRRYGTAGLSSVTTESAEEYMRLADTVDLYRVARFDDLSVETVRVYDESLNYFRLSLGDDFLVCELTQQHIYQFKSWLSKKIRYEGHSIRESGGNLSRRSLSRHLGAIRTFTNWCVAMPFVPLCADPFNGIKIPKAARSKPLPIISAESRHSMMVAAGESRVAQRRLRPLYNSRDTAILWLLWSTAIRAYELTSLTRDNLDTIRGRITVYGKSAGGASYVANGRSLKARTIPVSGQALKYVREWLAIRPQSETVFCSLLPQFWGDTMSPQTLGNLCDRLKRRGGASGACHPHSWRHASATHMIASGVPIATVSQLLGHASLEFTLRVYGHLNIQHHEPHYHAVDWSI